MQNQNTLGSDLSHLTLLTYHVRHKIHAYIASLDNRDRPVSPEGDISHPKDSCLAEVLGSPLKVTECPDLVFKSDSNGLAHLQVQGAAEHSLTMLISRSA